MFLAVWPRGGASGQLRSRLSYSFQKYHFHFFIVPKLEWLFWGWFRCFIQYALYQVIAAAVFFIIGNLILGILNLQPNGSISTVQLLGWFPVLLITFVASIYVLLRVPALTNHIFSGTSGGSSAQILQDFLA